MLKIVGNETAQDRTGTQASGRHGESRSRRLMAAAPPQPDGSGVARWTGLRNLYGRVTW